MSGPCQQCQAASDAIRDMVPNYMRYWPPLAAVKAVCEQLAAYQAIAPLPEFKTITYDCGCSATGHGIPNYCPEHGVYAEVGRRRAERKRITVAAGGKTGGWPKGKPRKRKRALTKTPQPA